PVYWMPRRNVCPTVFEPGCWKPEYTPSASACHTSTSAPTTGLQVATLTTLMYRRIGRPGLPSVMFWRMRFALSQYGPSTLDGVCVHGGGVGITNILLSTFARAVAWSSI